MFPLLTLDEIFVGTHLGNSASQGFGKKGKMVGESGLSTL